MSTDVTLQIGSSSSEDTSKLGEQLGRNCHGGEVFLFSSDLGGGKTTLIKGLAAGMGSKDAVSSPTFMVEKIYDCRLGMSLHHYDFYRLNDAGIVGQELAEVLEDPRAVVAVEWGDTITGLLNNSYVRVLLNRVKDDEDARLISITVPDTRSYLIEGVK